jgi:hypothetical protein
LGKGVYVIFSLGSEPHRDSFRIKPDTRADPERWDSILLGEFVNDDRRDSQEDSELPGIQSMPKTLDSIRQA